ncbi:hypothetical protein QQP08_015009 [Theobroma cacao]|nr:hypothetical protein QQP08_015009 [Theobroma cacao]
MCTSKRSGTVFIQVGKTQIC